MANPPPSKDDLVELYKIHIEEIRFQTKFNWERTQYFLVLNLGVIGVAANVWKADASLVALFLLCALFLSGIFMSLMSIAAIRQGHKYYRRSVLQKTRVELLLGLTNVESNMSYIPPFDLTTTSTPGKEDATKLLAHPDQYLNRPAIKKGQINWYIQMFFYMLAVVNLAGLVMALYQLVPQLIWK